MAIEKIRLPGTRLVAEIDYDHDCEAPYAEDDAVIIVILHREYNDPSKGACGTTPQEVAAWCSGHEEEWFSVPLWAYIHSGIALSAGQGNPFNCQWDSGQVGIVALKRSEWASPRGAPPEQEADLLGYAKGVAEGHGRWLNGECYGYTIVDPRNACYDGDSCWGFVGFEYVKEEAKDALERAARALKEEEDEATARSLEDSRPDLMGEV